jgi:hypothetical protein
MSNANKKIDVFLAGIMQGSLVEARIHAQDWREPISAAIEKHLPDAEIYCHYTRHRGSVGYELADIRATFAEGVERAAHCDVLIAYLPSASMGTAIEMHEAAARGAVVLTVTPLEANWVVRAYSDRVFPDIASLEAFLADPECRRLIAAKRRL